MKLFSGRCSWIVLTSVTLIICVDPQKNQYLRHHIKYEFSKSYVRYTFYIKPFQHNKVLNGDLAAERCQNMRKMCKVETARKV